MLTSDDDYSYLDSAAREELRHSRVAFRVSGAADMFLLTEEGFKVYFWLGTVQFDTLRRMLSRIRGVKVTYAYGPLVIGVVTRMTRGDIEWALECMRFKINPLELLEDREDLCHRKYDRFILEALLVESFATNRIDMNFELQVVGRDNTVA